VHLERKEDGKDYMVIKAEAKQGIDPSATAQIRDKIKKTVHSKILVSCDAEVCVHGGLPRYEGKAKRIFDNRGL
jgi:phenylacetate-coenzyme A ligase PaaK-like adenylate-forming protein